MTLSRPIFFSTLRGQADATVRLMIAGLLIILLYSFVSSGVTVNATPISGIDSLIPAGNYLMTTLMWIFGLGLISRDVRSGSIQLVILRPLTRASYVLSKWAALASTGFAVLVFIYASYLAHHGVTVETGYILIGLFGAQFLQVAAIASVITLFSTIPAKFSELGLLMLCVLIVFIFRLLNLRYGVALLDQALDIAWRVLLPSVAFPAGDADTSLGDLIASLIFNAMVAIGALASSMALMKKREFTYAE